MKAHNASPDDGDKPYALNISVPERDDQYYNGSLAPKLRGKTFLAVSSVCVIYMAQLITLVGVGAQGQTIAAHFNGSSNEVWFSASITLLTVVLGPIISQMADYMGRKVFLVSLTLCGAAGSIIVARASSMNMVIGGFCVIGIAFGVQPLLHTVTSEVLPRRWRGVAQATDMVSICSGTIFGLLLGGALNRTNDPHKEGFRSYFLINMAWYATATILTFFAYDPPALPKQKQYSMKEKIAMLDWVGYFFLASGLLLFSMGLSWSNHPYQWSDPHVSTTFAIGVFLLLCLAAYEVSLKKDGLFHHRLFNGNRNFAISILCVFCEGLVFFSANTYFPFETSTLYDSDALFVGLRYGITSLTALVSSILTGWYCAAYRRIRWVTVLAFSLHVIFFICMATSNGNSNTAVWCYPILLGTSLGMALTTLVTVAQLSTPPELISSASGLIIAIRSVGATVGIVIFATLFNNETAKMFSNIADVVVPMGLPSDFIQQFTNALTTKNETALHSIPNINPAIIEAGTGSILDTYVTAFRTVWIAGGCFTALSVVFAAFLLDPRDEFNSHIDAPLEPHVENADVA
ncbi:major facilitator superfamily domain-containing protein [Xylariales sp. PMI_506]|nr:major facilitator superfamily domain-containing protein [Xylariales sp. PMI_506]